MKILIIGQGGREHALAWKASQSPLVNEVFVIPGNDGMKGFIQTIDIKQDAYEEIIQFALDQKIDLTIIGSEQPLVDGLVDLMKAHNLTVFGPTKNAAMIEGSKTFAKHMMQTYDIPTASYQLIHTLKEAKTYLHNASYPVVIKVDGLAAGKGVVISTSYQDAIDTIASFLKTHPSILLESFLEGIEFSLIALVHEDNVYPFDLAQDYKRAYDDHLGPNTGGMGSYSPVDIIPKHVVEEAMTQIMKPLAKAMVTENAPFTGFLYGGLMWTKEGVKVIEFNARFGDPEAEVILLRLKSDLIEEIFNVLNHEPVQLEFRDEACVGVVLATKGYPFDYEKGLPLTIHETKERLLFHMGTRTIDDCFVTYGGRVLINVALGRTLEDARKKCYDTLNSIESTHLFYRSDIGLVK